MSWHHIDTPSGRWYATCPECGSLDIHLVWKVSHGPDEWSCTRKGFIVRWPEASITHHFKGEPVWIPEEEAVLMVLGQ